MKSATNSLNKMGIGAGKRAQPVKALDTKHKDLSSIPGSLIVEGENQLHPRCSLPVTCVVWHACSPSLNVKKKKGTESY